MPSPLTTITAKTMAVAQIQCSSTLASEHSRRVTSRGTAAVVRAMLVAMVLALCLPRAAMAQQWQAADPDSVPGRYVGSVVCIYKDGRIKVSSGVLVGPRHVLTAAHCLFDKDRKWAGRPESEWKPIVIMFTPGDRQGHAPYGSANATSWWISMPFFDNQDQDRDVGVIRLNRDLSTKTGGWAKLAEWPNEWTKNVTVYGYKYGTGGLATPRKIAFEAYNTSSWLYTFRGWHQFYSTRSVSESVASQGGGASGGPAFADGRVVGVFDGVRSSALSYRLRGFRLSNVPLNELKAWIAKNP